MKKQDLLYGYIELAKKLGKMPTIKEVTRLLASERQIGNNFGSLKALKKAALEECADLGILQVPVGLNYKDVENYRLEIEKTKQSSDNGKLIENISIFDYMEQFSESVFKGKIQAGKAVPKKFIEQRTHTLMLSDLHFGADIKGDETSGTDFRTIEESRRFGAVIRAASEYKPQYRKNTKLVITAIGDFIENNMHDPRTGVVLAEQVCRAIHYLSQGIAFLANHYPMVQVEWATGNHDRITSRHPKRAVHQKFDSFATMIAYSVKMALANVPNVTFNIPKQVYGVYEVYGHKIGYTHGCTFINPGKPYSTVNVKLLENQINKINAALPDKDELSAFLYGHTHIGHMINLPNGCVIMGNGGLPPSDDFGVSIGNLESNSGQWIFESVKGFPVGDARYIRVGKDNDNDASLDKVIKPWTGFNG